MSGKTSFSFCVHARRRSVVVANIIANRTHRKMPHSASGSTHASHSPLVHGFTLPL